MEKIKKKDKSKITRGGFAVGTNGVGIDLGNGLVLTQKGIGIKLGGFFDL